MCKRGVFEILFRPDEDPECLSCRFTVLFQNYLAWKLGVLLGAVLIQWWR